MAALIPAGSSIIAAMGRHEGDAGVAKAGCDALHNLTAAAENHLPLQLAGAGDAVVTAMSFGTFAMLPKTVCLCDVPGREK